MQKHKQEHQLYEDTTMTKSSETNFGRSGKLLVITSSLLSSIIPVPGTIITFARTGTHAENKTIYGEPCKNSKTIKQV